MNIIKTRLEAQIVLKNRLAAEANRLQSVTHEMFKSLVGVRIAKADGSFRKQYAHLVLVGTPPFKVFRQYDETLIRYKIHSDITYNEFNRDAIIYDTTFINVGILCDGILTELLFPSPARSDYTVEEVTALLENVKRLKLELLQVTNQLNVLGL